MIRQATSADNNEILAVINDAACRYRGVIPADLYKEPYMTAAHLQAELAAGVQLAVKELDGQIVGVMGTQDKGEVCIVRHSYVRQAFQKRGIGAELIKAHRAASSGRPMLVGCLTTMTWAIAFYQRHGFQLVS